MDRNNTAVKTDAERICHEWDRAVERRDVEAALALYAPDAILESPLVRHLLGTESGVCNGHEAIRKFLEKAITRKPAIRKHYSINFFTDGKTVIWEYPRATPSGEQMDLVNFVEFKNGLIQHHRIYWGWFGLKVLEEDSYHR